MSVPDERLAKLECFREAGEDPYPTGTTLPDRDAIAVHLDRADPDAEERETITVAGRVAALRDHGNSIFLDVRDGSGRLQVYLQKKVLGPERFALLKANLDLGDFVAARGELGRTRMGEVTLFCAAIELMTKALSVPPGEWYGVTDVETRYRQRYVDLLANPVTSRRFALRSDIVRDLRAALDARGFMEVETPMLHAIAGGATARPFTTHHNTLHMDLFLRIAPELFLKRLLVGGYERVFEIGRNFRNEGLSPRHNPEFTMLEAYWAYARADDWMAATEQILSELAVRYGARLGEEDAAESSSDPGDGTGGGASGAEGSDAAAASGAGGATGAGDVGGAAGASSASATGGAAGMSAAGAADADDGASTRLVWGDRTLDFTPPFARRTYAELVGEYAGADIFDPASVTAAAERQRLDIAGRSHAQIVADLFDECVESRLVDPTFVTDFPMELSPLAKARSDDGRVADRFELFIAGMEVANGFSELNDPEEQLARFERQVADRDPETPGEVDHDYVEALRYGMPPAAGIGIGIDRLVMLLTGAETIRDVILFPLLRPRAQAAAEDEVGAPSTASSAGGAPAGEE